MGKRLSQEDLRFARHCENVEHSKAKRRGKKIVGFNHFGYGDGFIGVQPLFERK